MAEHLTTADPSFEGYVYAPRPHYIRIIVMWVLSAFACYEFLSTHCIICGIFSDIIPFFIAGTLHNQEAFADRLNGWIKLSFMVLFYGWICLRITSG
jgi:hypothetical protein